MTNNDPIMDRKRSTTAKIEANLYKNDHAFREREVHKYWNLPMGAIISVVLTDENNLQ